LRPGETPVNAEPHKCNAIEWFDPKHMPPDTVPFFVTVIAKGLLEGNRYLETS
jgi:hypothetical protein